MFAVPEHENTHMKCHHPRCVQLKAWSQSKEWEKQVCLLLCGRLQSPEQNRFSGKVGPVQTCIETETREGLFAFNICVNINCPSALSCHSVSCSNIKGEIIVNCCTYESLLLFFKTNGVKSVLTS